MHLAALVSHELAPRPVLGNTNRKLAVYIEQPNSGLRLSDSVAPRAIVCAAPKNQPLTRNHSRPRGFSLGRFRPLPADCLRRPAPAARHMPTTEYTDPTRSELRTATTASGAELCGGRPAPEQRCAGCHNHFFNMLRTKSTHACAAARASVHWIGGSPSSRALIHPPSKLHLPEGGEQKVTVPLTPAHP